MAEPDETLEPKLVRQAQSGDEAAFGELYDLHAQAVYRFLL